MANTHQVRKRDAVTAKDVEIAESIVTSLAGVTFTKSPVVQLSVDPYFESQAFPDALIQIGFINSERTRASRGVWQIENVMLSLLIAGRQENHDATSIDGVKSWLDFVEEVVTAVQGFNVSGGTLQRIESEERYDADKLRADNQFRSLFEMTYQVR